MLPLVNRRFDYVVANSHVVKQYACQHEKLSAEKVKVIYNGVEIPNGTAHQTPAVFNGHPPSTVWICVVGSLTPVKRHDLVVRALAQIAKQPGLPPIRALFLGEGPQQPAIAALADELGVRQNIEFLGAVNNVGDYLRQVDIGVLCSDREGLSNAILEYMAYGLPVVATHTGGNSELVTEDTGYCVPVGDARAIASALASLILDPIRRREFGLAGHRRVVSDFSWPRAIENVHAFYDFVLASDRNVSPSIDTMGHPHCIV
jgi:glycosyltransferase involved in cell wall biosynthesis